MDLEHIFAKADKLYNKEEFTLALKLFKQAAMEGHTESMLRLASMYSTGEGVKCNYDLAEEWELRAVKAGNKLAMLNLGITYRLKGDIRSARLWFERALEAGIGSAALELAKLYMVSDKEVDTVRKYLTQALASNDLCDEEIEETQNLLNFNL